MGARSQKAQGLEYQSIIAAGAADAEIGAEAGATALRTTASKTAANTNSMTSHCRSTNISIPSIMDAQQAISPASSETFTTVSKSMSVPSLTLSPSPFSQKLQSTRSAELELDYNHCNYSDDSEGSGTSSGDLLRHQSSNLGLRVQPRSGSLFHNPARRNRMARTTTLDNCSELRSLVGGRVVRSSGGNLATIHSEGISREASDTHVAQRLDSRSEEQR